jgi:hypothetical protein
MIANPTHPIAIYDMFMNHRAEIIGAARRAPKGYRVWAVVNLDGTWDGIYGPFQRDSWPSRVHDGACYHICFNADPFLSHDTFNNDLSECFAGWRDVYDDDMAALRSQKETEGQPDV